MTVHYVRARQDGKRVMGSGPTIPDPHVKIETCPTSSDVILRSCGTHTHNNVMRLKMHEDWAGPPTQKTHLRVINTYGACARGGGRYGGSLGPFVAVTIALPLPSTFHFHRTSTSIDLPLPSYFQVFHTRSSHTHASACMGVDPAQPPGTEEVWFRQGLPIPCTGREKPS